MAKSKKESSEKGKGTVSRDKATGQFVSKSYAAKHPKTTLSESRGKKNPKWTDHTGPRRKK